jgi:hypothetical protein
MCPEPNTVEETPISPAAEVPAEDDGDSTFGDW